LETRGKSLHVFQALPAGNILRQLLQGVELPDHLNTCPLSLSARDGRMLGALSTRVMGSCTCLAVGSVLPALSRLTAAAEGGGGSAWTGAAGGTELGGRVAYKGAPPGTPTLPPIGPGQTLLVMANPSKPALALGGAATLCGCNIAPYPPVAGGTSGPDTAGGMPANYAPQGVGTVLSAAECCAALTPPDIAGMAPPPSKPYEPWAANRWSWGDHPIGNGTPRPAPTLPCDAGNVAPTLGAITPGTGGYPVPSDAAPSCTPPNLAAICCTLAEDTAGCAPWALPRHVAEETG
jgi:hypothetical protein